jgi:phage anti-repressor protein
MELIKLTKNKDGIETVNARELHAFLEVKTRFNDWIANRISEFGFSENKDFVSLTENLVSGGKQNVFHISIDMAKELSMLERNDKGKQARLYFIECERIAKSKQVPQSFAEALQLAANQAKQLEAQAAKVNYFDKVCDTTGLVNATQVGQKFKMSAVTLNKNLDGLNVYNRSVKRGRAFQQWFVDAGNGIMRQTELGYPQPLFTAKGEQWIIETFTTNGVI